MKKLLLINGPNLNLLGTREPDKYGTTTLAEIETDLRAFVESTGGTLTTYQSNHEGDLMSFLKALIVLSIFQPVVKTILFNRSEILIHLVKEVILQLLWYIIIL